MPTKNYAAMDEAALIAEQQRLEKKRAEAEAPFVKEALKVQAALDALALKKRVGVLSEDDRKVLLEMAKAGEL